MKNYVSFNEVKYYYNKFIVLSEQKKLATPIISKNACSTLFKVGLLEKGIQCDSIRYENLDSWWWLLPRLLIKEENLLNYKIVAVIRNPLDRISSAYNTIGNNISKEDYIDNVIHTLENFKEEDIDRHITSQFIQYDLSLIDMFIPIEYLDEYLHLINIDIERVNISKSPFKINNERLLNLLDNDFKIYNDILKGNKCFNPNNP